MSRLHVLDSHEREPSSMEKYFEIQLHVEQGAELAFHVELPIECVSITHGIRKKNIGTMKMAGG
jgi:hypothetical protein